MESTRFLIVGAGISGLSFANFIASDDHLILERDAEIGGYCKTVRQDGFVWDYSGHFFHFKRPEIEQYLRERMPDDEVRVVVKRSQIYYDGHMIDFPFQKNIHQLPKEDFIDCLYDLFFAAGGTPQSFKEMVYQRFGAGIAERFLVPYNEKLYACDLSELDADAMGRFFPHADLEGIVRNFRAPDNASYNSTFTYPRGGAIRYVEALASEVDPGALRCGVGVERVDLERKVATCSDGTQVRFEHLISSAPFDRLLQMCGLAHDPGVFRANKVLVFNLGFDRKGWEGLHWVYFPERRFSFYRIGFYDNIFDTDRLSLYVELGARSDEALDVDAARERVLADLARAGVIDDHRLVSHHTVTLDPAYVHITRRSQEAVARLRQALATRGVYSVGRYGGWTYCSIEDNIVEARDLASAFNAAGGGRGAA